MSTTEQKALAGSLVEAAQEYTIEALLQERDALLADLETERAAFKTCAQERYDYHFNLVDMRYQLTAVTNERDALRAQVGALTAERTVTHRKIAEASEAMSWAMANCDLAGRSYFFERKLEGLRGVLANAPTPSPLTRPAVPEGVTRIDAGFDFNGEAQHHIPKLTVWFTPVPVNGPCDAKGWKDRDALAVLLAAAPQPEATIKESSRVEAHAYVRQAGPVVPEIDYTELISACYRITKRPQGTPGCVHFKAGAEWFRSVMLAAAPQSPGRATEAVQKGGA